MSANSINARFDCKRPNLWILRISLILLLILPLIFSPAPISVDLNNHLVRYIAVADHFDQSTLSSYYTFVPGIFPNLGMDVLGSAIVYLFGPLIGPQIASIIVLLAVPLGFLALVKCIHGRTQAVHYALCVLLSYSHIFVWGFANFLLGAGVAMALFGLWVKLAESPRRQLVTGIVGGVTLIIIHALSFGIWGILLFSYEFGQWVSSNTLSIRSMFMRASRLLLIALAPFCYFLLSKTAAAPQGALFFAENLKKYDNSAAIAHRILEEIISRLELLFIVPDSGFWLLNILIGVCVLFALLYAVANGIVEIESRMIAPIVALVFLWSLMPPNMFGSGYANDRIPLLLWAVTFASLKWRSAEPLVRFIGVSIIAGFAFTHIVVVYITYTVAALSYRAYVEQLDKGRGSNVAVTLFYGGAGRAGLQAYCSAFEFLIFSRRGYAVQTFEYASQQPIKTDGSLRELVKRRLQGYSNEDRRLNAMAGRSALLEGFVSDHIAMGYEVVTVCGWSPHAYGSRRLTPLATGPFWSVFADRGISHFGTQGSQDAKKG